MPPSSTYANGSPYGSTSVIQEKAGSTTGSILLTLAGLASAAVLFFFLTHSLVALLFAASLCAVVIGWRIGLNDSIGIFVLLMIVQYIVIALLQFYGVQRYKEISAIKDVILVAAPIWYLTKARSIQIVAADVVIVVALLYVCAGQIFQPDIQGARVDWEWVLPYFLGRLMLLGPSKQALWAKCAIWTCAVLAILGAWEVFVLGPEPRTLLVSTTLGERHLDTGFFATGYAGLRAASTTVSPLSFAAFCMIGLLLWWVYSKNLLPALLVAAGLVLTLTRSAILMVVVGSLAIAVRRKERTRIVWFAIVLAIAVGIAIPTLDLGKFLSATFSSRGDVSLQGHEASLSQGIARMVDNPLGTGAGTVGPRAIFKSTSALIIESSYLTVAVEYGIFPGALFAIFVVMCLWHLYKVREPIGYAAFSVLLGFALLLGVGPANQDLAVSTWVWFIVGQGMSEAPTLAIK